MDYNQKKIIDFMGYTSNQMDYYKSYYKSFDVIMNVFKRIKNLGYYISLFISPSNTYSILIQTTNNDIIIDLINNEMSLLDFYYHAAILFINYYNKK